MKLQRPQALVLAPTRELAQQVSDCLGFFQCSTELELCLVQIQKVVMALGDYQEVSCHACIGGTNVRTSIQQMTKIVPQVIVGTPGRVLDMVSRGVLGKHEGVMQN